MNTYPVNTAFMDQRRFQGAFVDFIMAFYSTQ